MTPQGGDWTSLLGGHEYGVLQSARVVMWLPTLPSVPAGQARVYLSLRLLGTASLKRPSPGAAEPGLPGEAQYPSLWLPFMPPPSTPRLHHSATADTLISL